MKIDEKRNVETTKDSDPFKLELLQCKLDLASIQVQLERLKGACTAYESSMRRIAELSTDLVYDGVGDMRVKWINDRANNHLAEYYRVYPLKNEGRTPPPKEESDDSE